MTYVINKQIDKFRKWGLEFNTDKTQYINIGGIEQDIGTENRTIKNVYLRVIVDEDGNDNIVIIKK